MCNTRNIFFQSLFPDKEYAAANYPDILAELETEPFTDLLDAGCGPAPMLSLLSEKYPDPQAFFDSVKRCLRPGGRLVLRDMTTDKKIVRWFINTIELPLANRIGHGDVKLATRETVEECCKNAGLKVEKFEIRKGMRLHSVIRKEK